VTAVVGLLTKDDHVIQRQDAKTPRRKVSIVRITKITKISKSAKVFMSLNYRDYRVPRGHRGSVWL